MSGRAQARGASRRGRRHAGPGRLGRASLSLVAVALAVVLFFAVNMLAGAALDRLRLDLTEDRLYTLTPGSQQIARSVTEPITLTLYVSERQATDLPEIRTYARRVRELLEEYVRVSGGRITLRVVDPEPFSEAEDGAVRAGLTGVPVGAGGETLYFGLVGTNSTDGREVLPFLHPGAERFLEYEISRMIHVLSQTSPPVVGLLSGLPLDGTTVDPFTGTPRPGQPWFILEQLRSLFRVRTLRSGLEQIDADVSVLLIVHPQGLAPQTLYAIDQFVLGGGRAVVFVDPLCESQPVPPVPGDPLAAMRAERSSDLPRLFRAWGLELVKGKVAADRDAAQLVQLGDARRPQPIEYVVWLALRGDAMDQDDPITAQFSLVNVATAGVLRPLEGATTTFTPLLQTGLRSMLVDEAPLRMVPDVQRLLDEFEPMNQRLTIAARVRGPASTAFPEGPPRDEPLSEEDLETDEPPTPAPLPPEHLAESLGPINVVVVADADLLNDRFWIREQRLGSLRLGTVKIANNGDLLINAIDNLSGSDALIGVRARARYTRPFDRVEQIRAEAQQRYRQEELALQERIRQTQQRLNEQQRARPDQGELLLTPEQRAELEQLQRELVEARRQLRQVQLNMRRDIERLGRTLMLINSGLIPAVVAIGAVGLGAYRSIRRRADRRAAGGQD